MTVESEAIHYKHHRRTHKHPKSHVATHFYDAANPSNVPSGVYAAWYVNGFVWPLEDRRRMRGGFGISVEREAFWAEHARCLDIERGAAGPEDAVPFCQRRGAFLKAHHMNVNDAVIYVNRSNRGDVEERLKKAGFDIVKFSVHSMTVRTWEATLDGTDIEDVWACQNEGLGTFDRSILHGINDLRKAK